MKIPEQILKIGAPKNTKFLTQPNKRIDLPDSLSLVDRRKVRAYDLDWNNHVNNIVLIRFVMEAIKQSSIEDEDVTKVLIHFKNELRLGEEAEVLLHKANKLLNDRVDYISNI